MPRVQGQPRGRLEVARQVRTKLIRSIDYQTRKHIEDITERQARIAALTTEIEELEAQEAENE
jgi:hypothetical protein